MHPITAKVLASSRSRPAQLNAFISRYERHIIHAALLIWILIVTTTALNHEMWRDEVRALCMALDAENFWGLFDTLRNEGHPILWYWILRVAYWIWPTPVVLQIVSILIALAAVWLFLKKAPFHLAVKLLFIFSILPLVVYSVSARNYGIGMLLFFLFADTYCKPQRNNLLLGAIIALLANTNFFAMMFSGFLLCTWSIEEFLKVKNCRLFFHRFTLPAALALFGIALALFTISMDADSSVAPPKEILSRDFFRPILDSARHPGFFFSQLMTAEPPMRDLVLFALLAGLLVSPLYAGSLYAALFVYNVFSSVIMNPSARHQGMALVLIVTIYWIVGKRLHAGKKRNFLFLAAVYLVLAPLFFHQITLSQKAIKEDVQRELSSSAAFGKFINTNYQLRDAVILGDPDYILGALSYYIKNRIFYIHENRYAGYERFVKTPKKGLSLRDFLEAGERIRDTEHVPVVILLSHWNIPREKEYYSLHPFNRPFFTNTEEMLDFSARTIKIAEFNHAVSNENFEVFLLPQSKEEWLRHHGDYQQRHQLQAP